MVALQRSNDSVFRSPFIHLVNDLLDGPALLPASRSTSSILQADIEETAEGYFLTVDVPGIAPEQIHLEVENDVVTLKAERKAAPRTEKSVLHAERTHGSFSRAFRLPSDVDTARAEASYDKGVLTLALPKREETKPKVIAVNVKA